MAEGDGKMTTREVAELRRIVRMRFEVLGGQIAQRENEVANAIRKLIVKEHEDTIKRAKADVRKATGEITKVTELLEQKIRDLDALIHRYDDEGVTISGGHESRHYASRYSAELRSWLSRAPDSFVPKDLAAKVKDRMDELKVGAGAQRLNLKEMELDLLEELAVGQLRSDTAQEFLGRIPTVEKLLPLPEGMKEKELRAG